MVNDVLKIAKKTRLKLKDINKKVVNKNTIFKWSYNDL